MSLKILWHSSCLKSWLILQYSEAVDTYGNYYRNIAFYVVWALAIASVFFLVRDFVRFFPIYRPSYLYFFTTSLFHFRPLPCSLSPIFFLFPSITLTLYHLSLHILKIASFLVWQVHYTLKEKDNDNISKNYYASKLLVLWVLIKFKVERFECHRTWLVRSPIISKTSIIFPYSRNIYYASSPYTALFYCLSDLLHSYFFLFLFLPFPSLSFFFSFFSYWLLI